MCILPGPHLLGPHHPPKVRWCVSINIESWIEFQRPFFCSLIFLTNVYCSLFMHSFFLLEQSSQMGIPGFHLHTPTQPLWAGSPQWLLLSDSLRISVPASEQPGNVCNFFLISILHVVISCCKMNISGSSVCMGFLSWICTFFFLVVRNIFLLWGLPARDEDFPLPLCPVLKTPLGTCFLPSPIFQDLRGPQLFLQLPFQGCIYIKQSP